jgi:MoaA/NifB/PqqE/SkfB family radical SAM enzyme
MPGGSFWSSLRYLWLMLAKGHRFGSDFLTMTNRRFCNGPDKVIGWSKGYPSYYLLSPPMFSRPAMNSLTTRLVSIYQWRKLPDLVSLAVTDGCNMDCELCSFAAMRKAGKSTLTTNELRRAVRQAQELGVATINLVGGEPLLRDDLPEVIRAVDQDLSQVILFTNGSHLAARARELRAAGLTSVIVALDSADAAEHDRRKRAPDAFARALAGIEAARREKLLVGISTVARPGDLENGGLVRLFELGRKLRVHQILVFDAVSFCGDPSEQSPAWTQASLDALIELCADYHRRKEYPGIHAYAYSKSHRSLGCSGGVSHFYISPYGDVCPCDFDPASVGNLRESPLYLLWDRFARQGITCSSLDGCRCQSRPPALLQVARPPAREELP